MRRPRIIRQRDRIFLGCEGESEQSYGVLLQKLAESHGASVHVIGRNLQPATCNLQAIRCAWPSGPSESSARSTARSPASPVR
jgi:hypothetical protein